MSLPNRLQNIKNSPYNVNTSCETQSFGIPVSIEATEEEGQVYLDVTKHIAKSIAKYKISQLKSSFKQALHINSQYNDEGFQ